ncbi:MAG: hypothetical protein K6E77_03610 [Lachnospiraceae bacterium]|nr:hypothetical protein [Lachnospiraceae bacterium]
MAEPLAKYVMAENEDLTCLDERLGESVKTASVFPKTEAGLTRHSSP